jgi:tellurite resistance protein
LRGNFPEAGMATMDGQADERAVALMDAMMLAAVADGHLGDEELRAVIDGALQRPEFAGIRAGVLDRLAAESAARLTRARAPAEVLDSLRSRLLSRHDRKLAFALAAAVALADRQASEAEISLLAELEMALGLSKEEAAHVIDVVGRGGSLGEAIGDEDEVLYAKAMALVAAADGRLEESEALAMVDGLVSDPLFARLGREQARASIARAVEGLGADGLETTLRRLASALSSREQRRKAYGFAVKVARASGETLPAEEHVLDLLQQTFELADEDVADLRAQ